MNVEGTLCKTSQRMETELLLRVAAGLTLTLTLTLPSMWFQDSFAVLCCKTLNLMPLNTGCEIVLCHYGMILDHMSY